jgi:c-di-GMP-binding flagellar brake protein YcgR
MNFPSSNRRKHARKALRRNAHLLFPDRPSILVRTTDISKGGLGAIADVNLLPGTSCMVRLSLPLHPQDKTVLNIQVQVAHSVFSHAEKGFKVGFQFIDLPPLETEVIAQFLMH